VSAGLSRLISHRFLAVGSLCDVTITSRELPTSKIKHSVWNVFMNSVIEVVT